MQAQPYKNSRVVLRKEDLASTLEKLAEQIVESHPNEEPLALVGIYTGGVPLSERLQALLQRMTGRSIPVGMVDITLYRDDALEGLPQPVVGETRLDFTVDGTKVILVDDVLFTGRTVRAALDAIVDFGRPKVIELLVVADRGHREFPIQPNYVGVTIPTDRSDSVKLTLEALEEGEDTLTHFSNQ